jgi:hypothetical protein
MIVVKTNPAKTIVVPRRYGGITVQTMLLRKNQNREPFAILWTVPCKIIALVTGSTVTRTAIRIMPPAIPTTPDRIEVNNTQSKTRIATELLRSACLGRL